MEKLYKYINHNVNDSAITEYLVQDINDYTDSDANPDNWNAMMLYNGTYRDRFSCDMVESVVLYMKPDIAKEFRNDPDINGIQTYEYSTIVRGNNCPELKLALRKNIHKNCIVRIEIMRVIKTGEQRITVDSFQGISYKSVEEIIRLAVKYQGILATDRVYRKDINWRQFYNYYEEHI